MLADDLMGARFGAIDTTVHRPATFLREILEFVSNCLPLWRDDPKRARKEKAETKLTSQLCKFLNSRARKAGLDYINFNTEDPDTVKGNRVIDLTVSPKESSIWIDGREHTYYDPLIPIECKRLPTPESKDRERREYLHTRKKTTGGVQRFKSGYHGSEYKLGAMIGYVQTRTAPDWIVTLNHWINAMSKKSISNWSLKDSISIGNYDVANRTLIAKSEHNRSGCEPIELFHLLVDMRDLP